MPVYNSGNSEFLTKKQDNRQNNLLFVENYKKNIPIIWNLHFYAVIFVFISAFYKDSQKLTQFILHSFISGLYIFLGKMIRFIVILIIKN